MNKILYAAITTMMFGVMLIIASAFQQPNPKPVQYLVVGNPEYIEQTGVNDYVFYINGTKQIGTHNAIAYINSQNHEVVASFAMSYDHNFYRNNINLICQYAK